MTEEEQQELREQLERREEVLRAYDTQLKVNGNIMRTAKPLIASSFNAAFEYLVSVVAANHISGSQPTEFRQASEAEIHKEFCMWINSNLTFKIRASVNCSDGKFYYQIMTLIEFNNEELDFLNGVIYLDQGQFDQFDESMKKAIDVCMPKYHELRQHLTIPF